MPNIVPGALWRPVDVGNRAARRKGRGLVGHVAVSSSKNLVPGPLATRAADWHLYLPKDGPAIQYIDLDVQCWASGAGNPSLVAFESEGGLGTTAQVNAEPWTDNQLTWAARILRHLHDTEGVPLQVMNDSLPGSRGFGTHRLGIDPWRVAGGELWSSSRGKTCPGDAKHAQRAEIVARAQQMNGATDMELTELINYRAQQYDGAARSLYDSANQTLANIGNLTKQVADLTAAVAELRKAVGTSGAAPVDVKAVAEQLTVVPKP